MDKSVHVFQDAEGNNIVVIDDIRFKGRQHIAWEEVEEFVKQYVGNNYVILETADKIYIGPDFPGEIKGSDDTKRLKGASAKAKANATQQLPLLIKKATNKRWNQNYKIKHNLDAKFGWYRFTTRFALPIYNNENEVTKYNIYRIEMLVRHASNNNMYLYDLVNIKKEKETKYPI